MTMMITPPANERFEALLADYMSEPQDEGFSDAVASLTYLQQNKTMKNARLTRLRTGFLMGGCFMGGIIAATQLKPAWALLENVSLPSGPALLAPLVLIFAFAVWTSLDSRDAGTL